MSNSLSVAHIYSHAGNRAFLELARKRATQVRHSPVSERKAEADKLVKEIRDRGGSFRRYLPDDGVWREVQNEEAVRKVMQVWREPSTYWSDDSEPDMPSDLPQVSTRSHRHSLESTSNSRRVGRCYASGVHFSRAY